MIKINSRFEYLNKCSADGDPMNRLYLYDKKVDVMYPEIPSSNSKEMHFDDFIHGRTLILVFEKNWLKLDAVYERRMISTLTEI